MNIQSHIWTYARNTDSPAQFTRRFVLTFHSVAFSLFFLSSCSGLWTSLKNPVDPEACDVDTPDYGLLFYGDQEETANIDPVLEQLRQSSGYQVLFLGFNDYTYDAGSAPFVMITTKEISQTYGQNGINVPILNAMTITDSLGNAYTIGSASSGMRTYEASDGKSYTYCLATLRPVPIGNTDPDFTLDMDRTYTVNIDTANVFASDGTPLNRPYQFVVRKASASSGLMSLGLMDGLTTAFSSDFSTNDPYWEWSKDKGSGSIDIVGGNYNLVAQCTDDGSAGYIRQNLFCKRYPYAIRANPFAVRVTASFPRQTAGTESGLYVSDSSGDPVAAILLYSTGWFQCFCPGSSTGVLRKIRDQEVPNYDMSSTVLGFRQDGGRLYFYVNGECVTITDITRGMITNAGLFIAASDPQNPARASFDDFAIAQ